MSGTKTIKKLIATLLILSLSLASLVACAPDSAKSVVKEPGTIIEQTDKTITIVDQAGREVCVEKYPESIALCYRVVIRFLLALDMGDKITGIGKTEEFLEYVQPSLKDCADVGKGVADIEALAELKPDIFIHKADDLETLEAVEKLGITTIGIDVETPEEMIQALNILGTICEKSDRATELIEYYQSELDELNELTNKIEDKKSAIVMGSSIGKVADGSMLQGEMIERAGGVNCASELSANELWPTAGTEEIFEWDPDYIFITNGETANYSVDDIMKNKAWKELKAVKNKHVYVIPAEKDSWEFPSLISLLGIEFMMNKMYPELMPGEALDDNIRELYELLYGIEADEDYLGY